MVLATNPSSVSLSVGHRTVSFPVDQPSVIRVLSALFTSANGTNFTPFKNVATNANYSTPGATNFRIFGIEDISVIAASTTSTLMQLGFDDDGAGTNWTLLSDLGTIASFLSTGPVAGTIISGFPVGVITVPTGKFLTLKATNTTNGQKVNFVVSGIETL